MKILSLKNVGMAGSVLVVALAVFYFTQGKSSKATLAPINPAFGEYISSYTSLSVNSGSTVRIILSRDAVDSAAVGEESSSKLFEFTPSIKGITVWLDRRTVEFRPSARLQSGQVYGVSFLLSKLVQVPNELSTFEYAFQVIPQNYELSIDNIRPYVRTELARQKIEGTISTADFAESAVVETMLSVSQESKSLKVSWTHTTEGKQHSFIVEDVERKEKASRVILTAAGKNLAVNRQEEKEIEIPALNDFKVTNVSVEQGSNQHIVIQFSDPLSEKQNLEGMISITGLGSLDFEIKDNEVSVFPPVRQIGTKQLTVETGIRNALDYRMPKGGVFEVSFEQLLPAVRFTGKGNILPSSDGLILPFEAVNLKSVNVQVVKIFENNILQFLQVNDIDGNQELRRVGKPIFKKTVSLENAGVTDLGKWNRFTLDLAKLLNAEPGAIYKVGIGFRKSNAAYVCDGAQSGEETASPFDRENFDDEGEREYSYWDSYEDGYYYGEGYDWQQRDNPCNSAYYNGEKNISRNVIASDIGLIAKRGADGNTIILANDLKTTQPMGGVQIELYDYQQQLLGSANTGSDGKSIIATKGNPFVLIARSGPQRGYLKLQDGESLSLSNFDVGGEQIKRGIKGFLYGERGVWRPGDSLYLTFILEDKLKLMPASHPVIFELQNPQGQVTTRLVRSSSENGFYKFAAATVSDAPTGYWLGRVKVGGTEFTQPIRIETVKPNRLRIKLDFGVDKISTLNNNITGSLQVDWLHGAPGKNLKAQFEVLLTKGETKFARYPDYIFEDPTKT
ncbi:MAG TPA: MG2 domain-containing protein, partial [Cyclobacteriaceae bacterium]|nr:MG2 domain-containing protein [Cyclobacteriaceae bacterium]